MWKATCHPAQGVPAERQAGSLEHIASLIVL